MNSAKHHREFIMPRKKQVTVEIWEESIGIAVATEKLNPQITDLSTGIYIQHKNRRWEFLRASVIGVLSVLDNERHILNDLKEKYDVVHPCMFVVRRGGNF